MVLLVALFLLMLTMKIVLIDSPVGAALGDVIRGMAPERAPRGAATRGEVEELRREIEELRDRIDRVVEEQAFLTRLLTEPDRLRLGSGSIEEEGA